MLGGDAQVLGELFEGLPDTTGVAAKTGLWVDPSRWVVIIVIGAADGVKSLFTWTTGIGEVLEDLGEECFMNCC